MSPDRELLPCPFCEGKAERVELGTTDGDPNAGGTIISCSQCDACSAVQFGTKENLVDNWNRRSAQHLTARVAALEDALRFYADPELYRPHPHGPAFERRDKSFCAIAALARSAQS